MDQSVVIMGTAHTEYKQISDVPRCSKDCKNESTITILPEYADCLLGLERFPNIFVFSWMHKSDRNLQQVRPHFGQQNRDIGVFATRSPARPNPIGMTLVKVNKIEGTTLYVTGLDLLDGTPIIDIKKFDTTLDSPDP